MGATESQLKQRDDDEFVTHMADTDKCDNQMNPVASSAAAVQSPRQQHPQQFMHSHHNSPQSQPQQSQLQPQLNERQLENELAQAEDELNDMRQRTHSMRERRKGTIKVRRTEPEAATKVTDINHAAGVAASPASAAAASSPFSDSQSSSPTPPSHNSLPRPPSPPLAKATHSEATLAYLMQSLESNRHQHIDVIRKQIELLKEKLNEFRCEKEKEAKEDEMKREEGQRKQWLQAMNEIAQNHSSNISPCESTTANIPDPKKAKHESTVEPSFSADPVFQQQSSLDYSHLQFQQIRDTIARDEVYSYPNDDDDDDEMQYPPFMQQEDQDLQQDSTHYDAIYARMNEIIQQDTDRDAGMTGESTYNAPPISFDATPLASPLPSIPINLPSPSTSTTFPSSSHPLLITHTELSRNIFDLCLADIIKLEDKYLSGHVSFQQMRFALTILHNVLIPQHERELIEHFEKIRIKQTQDLSNSTTIIIPASHSILNGTLLSLPTYNDSFTPDLPVDDDPDGCARLRSQVFDPAIQTQSTTQQGHLKRKKHLRGFDSNELVASPPAPNVSSASSPSSVKSLPSPSTAIRSAPFSLYRMNYVNHAFESLFGFTQSEIKGSSFYDLTLRKDHCHASHRIRHRWWSERAIDSMMYEVRVKKDGTWIYCLVHWRISFLKGKLRQMVMSFMPLPDDEEHPMPPYVESVDLDIDTLLYGYKPPAMAAHN